MPLYTQPAITLLASLYEQGNGTEVNVEEAEKWYLFAAIFGDAKSKCSLASKGDDLNAAKLFEKAGNHGHRLSQRLTAIAYQLGIAGQERDHYKAIEYACMAAEQGDEEGMLMLALYYAEGIWIEQNKEEALRLLILSAEKGNNFAPLHLSLAYKDGSLGRKDSFKEYHWLKVSADNGNTIAKVSLAVHYLDHDSAHKAIPYLKEASDEGDGSAQYLLALCYLKGT